MDQARHFHAAAILEQLCKGDVESSQYSHDTSQAAVELLRTRGLVQRDTRNSFKTYYVATQKGKEWREILRVQGKSICVFGNTRPADDQALRSALHDLSVRLRELTADLAKVVVGMHTLPARVHMLAENCKALEAGLIFDVHLDGVPETLVLACKVRLLYLRQHKERLEAMLRSHELLVDTEKEVRALADILRWPDLIDFRSRTIPQLGDFVNVGAIQRQLGWEMSPPANDRAPDEKFAILLAPQVFSSDYDWVRRQAQLRDRDFAVAYVDIDDFKLYNKRLTETVVDQDFLPFLMRAIEAFCFGRAFAYREGGDEYIVLLMNGDHQEAEAFFGLLQTHLGTIKYPSTVKDRPTFSLGVHVVTRSAEVTSLEAKLLANSAKAWAKHNGKLRGKKGMVEFSTSDNVARVISGQKPVLPPDEDDTKAVT